MNCKPGYTATTRRHAREDGAIELFTSKGDAVIVDSLSLDRLPKGFLHISLKGYARIEINRHTKRRCPFVHRLVLGLEFGDGKEVDHINGNKLDNRLSNLRIVTRSINQLNKTKAFSSNSIGLLGVTHDPRRISKPFRASMMVDQKHIHIGTFATAEEAHSAYMRAKGPFISAEAT